MMGTSKHNVNIYNQRLGNYTKFEVEFKKSIQQRCTRHLPGRDVIRRLRRHGVPGRGPPHAALQQPGVYPQHGSTHSAIKQQYAHTAGHPHHHATALAPVDPMTLNMIDSSIFYPSHSFKRANFWRLDHLTLLSMRGRLHPSLKQLWDVKSGHGLQARAGKYRDTHFRHIPMQPQHHRRELALLFLTDPSGRAVYMLRSQQGWTLPGGAVDPYLDRSVFLAIKRHWNHQTNAGLPQIRHLVREKMKRKVHGTTTVFVFFGCLDYGQSLPTTRIAP